MRLQAAASTPPKAEHNVLQGLLDSAAARGEVFDGFDQHFTSDLPVFLGDGCSIRRLTIENTAPPGSPPRLCQPVYVGSFHPADLPRATWARNPDASWADDDVVVWRTDAGYLVHGRPVPRRMRIGAALHLIESPFGPLPARVANFTSGRLGLTPHLPHVPIGFVRGVSMENVTLIASGEGFGLGRCGVHHFATRNLTIKASNPGPSNGIVRGVMEDTRVESTRCGMEVALGCYDLEIRGWHARVEGDSELDPLPAVKLGQSCERVRVTDLAVDATGAGMPHAVRATHATDCSIAGVVFADRATTVSDSPGGCDLTRLAVYGPEPGSQL